MRPFLALGTLLSKLCSVRWNSLLDFFHDLNLEIFKVMYSKPSPFIPKAFPYCLTRPRLTCKGVNMDWSLLTNSGLITIFFPDSKWRVCLPDLFEIMTFLGSAVLQAKAVKVFSRPSLLSSQKSTNFKSTYRIHFFSLYLIKCKSFSLYSLISFNFVECLICLESFKLSLNRQNKLTTYFEFSTQRLISCSQDWSFNIFNKPVMSQAVY